MKGVRSLSKTVYKRVRVWTSGQRPPNINLCFKSAPPPVHNSKQSLVAPLKNEPSPKTLSLPKVPLNGYEPRDYIWKFMGYLINESQSSKFLQF